jgi:hypothetical protein
VRSDIDEVMKPLIQPWDSGRGIMVTYHANDEVLQHLSLWHWASATSGARKLASIRMR